MNAEIETYLASLDLANPVRKRIIEVVAGLQVLCGGELERLFVSDAVNPAGEHVFESIWGFRGGYWMEARNFLAETDMDISYYAHSIKYLGVQYKNYTFDAAPSADSRLSIEIETEKVRYSTLAATGHNCGALAAILTDLLLPSLKEAPEAEDA